MIKDYICFFKKNKKHKEIRFKINQNSLTELWSKTVIKEINDGNFTPRDIMSTIDNLSLSEINSQIIDLISNLAHYDNRFNDLNWPRHVDQLTNKRLNKLHEYFHLINEEVNFNHISDNFNQNLKDLNNKIHIIENIKTNNKFYLWKLNHTHLNNIPIPIEMRAKYWNVQTFRVIKPGTLFLGYDTIGKNLSDVYGDDDVELALKGGIRQKIDISTECVFQLRGKIEFNNRFKIQRWLKENKIQIDMKDPIYRYNHDPILGVIRTEMKIEELENLFACWDFYKIEIS